MFLSPRISTVELARLCRRLATSLEAGIDLRTVWSREADRATLPAARPQFRTISQAVADGQSLSEAIRQTGDFFPEIFHELTRVGEQTGRMAESFSQLAEHYEEQLRLRRMLVSASIWPLVELGVALAVVGFLIWFMGVVDTGMDMLGLGLKGTGGLVVYLVFLGMVAGGLLVVFQAIRRGLAWTGPIQRLLLRLPLLGRPFEYVALSRLAWSLGATLDAGMGLRQALRLSLESTHNARYTDHIPSIDAVIEAGQPIHEAFLGTGAFPQHFLEAVRVGEDSGRLVESMTLLSRQYREQAEAGFKALAVMGGFGIWVAVAAIIIVLIFRFALIYLGMISDALP